MYLKSKLCICNNFDLRLIGKYALSRVKKNHIFANWLQIRVLPIFFMKLLDILCNYQVCYMWMPHQFLMELWVILCIFCQFSQTLKPLTKIVHIWFGESQDNLISRLYCKQLLYQIQCDDHSATWLFIDRIFKKL